MSSYTDGQSAHIASLHVVNVPNGRDLFVEDDMHNVTTAGANGFLECCRHASSKSRHFRCWRRWGGESCDIVKKGKSPGVQDSLSNQKEAWRQIGQAMQTLIPSEVNASEQYSRITIATFPEFVRKLIFLHGGTLTHTSIEPRLRIHYHYVVL